MLTKILVVKELGSGDARVARYVTDEEITTPYEAWKAVGFPENQAGDQAFVAFDNDGTWNGRRAAGPEEDWFARRGTRQWCEATFSEDAPSIL